MKDKKSVVYFSTDDFGYNIPCPWSDFDCEKCPHSSGCEELAGLLPNWWDNDEEVEMHIAKSVITAHRLGYQCTKLAKRVGFTMAEKMGWD